MKKLIVLFPFVVLGIIGQANAQTLGQITGRWSVSKTGPDVDNTTAQEMGRSLEWVIKEANGKIGVQPYSIYAAGFVGNATMVVTAAQYANGRLEITTKPLIGNEIFPLASTNYKINFSANGCEASGTYVEIIQTLSQRYNFFTKTFEKAPDVKNSGTLTMSRLSKSTAPPKAKPQPASNAGTPAFVPPMNFPMPYVPSGGSMPSPSPRSRVDCSVEYNSCWHICDSAPCFGSCDTNRMSACNARCEADRNRCQMR